MCALSKGDKIQQVSQTVGKFLVLLLVLLLSVGITAGQGQIYHVSPDESDTNIGSVAAPLATIQHALNIVQPGDTVILQPGTYIMDISSPGKTRALMWLKPYGRFSLNSPVTERSFPNQNDKQGAN